MIELGFYDAFVLSLGSLFFGIFLLVRGGGWTIDSAVYIAMHRGISPMVVGFTVVAFGTSFPELVVSVVANFQGSPGIALGNVVGSNIANILFIIGFCGMFVTLRAQRTPALIRDLAFMILATLWLAFLLSGDGISRVSGFFMIVALLMIVGWQYFQSRHVETKKPDLNASVYQNNFSAFSFLLLGLIAIAAGAEFLVNGAQVSAQMMGIPESVIALSVIAIGTSLPELSTSLIACRRGQDDLVIGNIIGSNVFNILMIIGSVSMLKPIETSGFSPELIWIAFAVAVVFSGIFLAFGKISRLTGVLFCLAYFAYNVYIYVTNLA